MNVSIVIPAFNRLWALPEAIASCRPGSDGVEIIVVDDGSTDGTWQWLSAQPHVVALRQDNQGKPYAVNRGFEAARGKYVRFLDSDDMLIEGANDRQFAAAEREAADIVVAGYDAWYQATGRTERHGWEDCGDFIAQQLGERDSSHYSAYLFRKDFLGDLRHRPEFAFRDDRMFIIEAALRLPRVASVDGPTLLHRHHGKGRVQFRAGQAAIVTDWQEQQMYRRAYAAMSDRSLLTERRRKALAKSLWPLILRVSGTNLDEGRKLRAWQQELDPDFRSPGGGAVDNAYRRLGFRVAQPLISALKAGYRLLRRSS